LSECFKVSLDHCAEQLEGLELSAPNLDYRSVKRRLCSRVGRGFRPSGDLPVTVDDDPVPRVEGRRVGGQVNGDPGEVFRLAPTSRPNDQRIHQAWTPSRRRNFSAPRPCSMASVDIRPASMQVAAATVTERGASFTGQPVRGLRMWL